MKNIEPYLYFGGRCEEALEFYKTALGAQVDFIMRWDECPEKLPPGTVQPGFEKKVMHASFQIGANKMMASDDCKPGAKFDGFRLAITAADETEAKKVFNTF